MYKSRITNFTNREIDAKTTCSATCAQVCRSSCGKICSSCCSYECSAGCSGVNKQIIGAE